MLTPMALCPACTCSKVKVGGAYCSATPLVGCPYGAMFTLGADGKSLERTE